MENVGDADFDCWRPLIIFKFQNKNMLKKGLFGGAIVLVGLIAGFIFLLRGCLSGYDERSAITPVLYFEKDGKAVVFTIIQYGKATSYSSGPRGTFKSMSTNYYIQCNDATTAELITNKKIKHHSDIKFYPIKMIGGSNNKAWVFIGEILAYDPFTLEKVADKEIIADKNPQLKGKMPDEERYYTYDNISNTILITATDGMKYSLSTASLLATAIDDDLISKSPAEARIKQLKKQEDSLEQQYRAGYDRYRAFNKLYSDKKISYAAYDDSTRFFRQQQDSVSKWKSFISAAIRDLDDLQDANREIQNKIEDLMRGSKNYSSICTKVDTVNGKWYGLLSAADLEKPETRFRYEPVYAETARNRLYTAATTVKDPAKKAIELVIGKPEKLEDAVYLQGGFLLNKSTALPVHLANNAGFIVCYKEKVGNAGSIMLSAVDFAGKSKWSVNTMLTEFEDWIFTGSRLVILGRDNKEISSGNANLLISIDLQNGKAVKHDYFTQKMR